MESNEAGIRTGNLSDYLFDRKANEYEDKKGAFLPTSVGNRW